MIVDCHTQVWDERALFTARASPEQIAPDPGTEARHLEALGTVDRAIVLGFKSRFLNAEIPNRHVADYVRRNSSKLIGFAGIDPTDGHCLDEIRTACEELNLKGVCVSPALQDYHPSDTRAMRVYEECARRRLPVMFEQSHRCAQARMEFARPYLLDEVAREFPDLRVVIAHMGYPWIEETIALLGKHEHVYADVSGLLGQPWRCYTALLAAYEHGVIDRLLFGSDFPYLSPAEGIEALYSINQIRVGSNLVAIPRQHLSGIVERDALALLGIESAGERPPSLERTFADDIED